MFRQPDAAIPCPRCGWDNCSAHRLWLELPSFRAHDLHNTAFGDLEEYGIDRVTVQLLCDCCRKREYENTLRSA